MVGVRVGGIFILLIVAVHDTIWTLRVSLNRRIAEYRTWSLCRCRRGADPTVLHISPTRLGDTCASERSCDSEVIDITAEVVEEWIVESADGMTITMEVTREALISIICNWRPLISGFGVRMTQVAP